MIKETYNNLLKEEDAEQLMNWLGLKDVKLRKNNSPNGSHVTVTTTSVPEYVETQLQNNQDWKNYYSKHQVIDAGGAFGDAQSIIVFHREDQPELEDEPWTDPAGGTHYGGEDDPAAAYLEEDLNENKMKKSQLRKIIREAINSMGIDPLGYHTDQGYETEENPQDIEYWLKQIEGMSLDAATRHLGLKGLPSSMTDKILQHHNTDIVDTFDEFSDEENPFPSSRKSIDQLDKDDLYENTMRRSELKELVKEAYLEHLREEDDADIEDEMEDDFEAEPAVAQDGESKNQENAPRKRINFENRELEMLVDVNKNATKKGIKIQFLSDDELSKEERTKLVSSLQTYLDEGLAKFVKGAKLNIDSDQDVPNKTKTVGFTIKIGDVFGLVSKVFANRGDDEEDGEEVEAEETETEETEELQELRRQIRGFLK